MPHAVSLGEPSLWQRLKGERPSYRTAAVWKLVAYGDAPEKADIASQNPTIARGSSNDAVKDVADDTTEGGRNQRASPNKKG